MLIYKLNNENGTLGVDALLDEPKPVAAPELLELGMLKLGTEVGTTGLDAWPNA